MNGLYHGLGVLRSSDGSVYEGSFERGQYHGMGTMRYANGEMYVGAWQGGLWDGAGQLTFPNKTAYTGAFRMGMRHGEGTLRYGAGGSYTGDWKYNRWWGIGRRAWASGAEYEGEWFDGRMQGRGIFKRASGDIFIGSFRDGKFEGEGTLVCVNGDRYQGHFQNGVFSGRGRYTYADGSYYDGEYNAQLRCGVSIRAPTKKELTARDTDIAKALRMVAHRLRQREQAQRQERRETFRRGFGGLAPSRSATPASRESSRMSRVADGAHPRTRSAEHGTRSGTASRQSRFRPLEGDDAVAEGGVAAVDSEDNTVLMALYHNERKVKKNEFELYISTGVDTRPGHILVGSEEDVAWLAAGDRGRVRQAPALDGKRHGVGVAMWVSGARYEGEWWCDEMHGFGTYQYATGERYEGNWVHGVREGEGTCTYAAHGRPYVCPLGYRHDGTGACVYRGEWRHGHIHGTGSLKCCDGREYNGEWSRDKPHGVGWKLYVPYSISTLGTHVLDEEGRVWSAAYTATR
ncbi:hypothetical protein EON62_00865, partial [archaeon]